MNDISTQPRKLKPKLASLLHIQTKTFIDLPNLSVIRIGKANERESPDIDISGLPNADVVPQININIHREENTYFIENIGITNEVYLNRELLIQGNRYQLNAGYRISLGKEELILFIFATI